MKYEELFVKSIYGEKAKQLPKRVLTIGNAYAKLNVSSKIGKGIKMKVNNDKENNSRNIIDFAFGMIALAFINGLAIAKLHENIGGDVDNITKLAVIVVIVLFANERIARLIK